MPSPHRWGSVSGVPATGPYTAAAAGPDKRLCLLGLAMLIAVKTAVLLAAAAWAGAPAWLQGLRVLAYKWDGARVIEVSLKGYRAPGDATIAPLMPSLIAAVAHLGLPAWASALLVANAASLALAPLLCLLYGPAGLAAVLLIPTVALYTTAPYTEALSLPLEALSLYLALRGRWGWAALSLGLAGLARYQAWVPAAGAALGALASGRRRGALYLGAAASAPLLAAALVGLHYYGDPLEYLRAEGAWDAGLGVPFYSQARWLLGSWFTGQTWHLGAWAIRGWVWVARNALFYAPYLAGLALLVREKRAVEAGWSLAVILVAASVTGVPAASAPRLLLGAFPAIAALARGRPVDAVGLAVLTALAWSLALWTTTWHLEAFFA